jgi:membrane-bound lytic murein transglycosylase B
MLWRVKQLMRKIILFAALAVCILPALCPAEDTFEEWLAALKAEAMANGIAESTLEAAFEDLRPLDQVIELDRNQPEFTKDFSSYLKMTVTPSRISKGRSLMNEHRGLLQKIKDRYGVQPRFIVAIWGLESHFGTYLGRFPVISAVATLAYDARRSAFFRAELLNALKILDEGHIDVPNMQGSWAGAMGQLQFMPSTFVRFAVDEDNDGRKDIWRSLPDVFASAANYLSSSGWNGEYTWGREVTVPPGLDETLYGMKTPKRLAQWQEIGIRRVNGDDLPAADIDASLIRPSGSSGPAFLVYKNYRAILRWNHSHLYALAVCRLSDKLASR